MSVRYQLRNPLKTARGIGSAKSGTDHFIAQRITSVALTLLSVWFVVLAISWIGDDYAAIRASVARPLNATLLVAFLLAMFWHSKLGVQVVIEDYVHSPWLAVTAQLLNIFVNAIAALASVLAVVRIALGS